MKSLRLKKEQDRKKWGGRIREADPHLRGINSSRKEI